MPRKSQPPPTFSSRISRDRAAKAVDALLKCIRSQPKHQKAQLLEHDEVIHLVVTMCKIPHEARVNPYYLPLPYPLHSLRDAAACLFVDDSPKAPIQPSDIEARIQSKSIPITDVITVGSLKTDYIPYESRRKLCGSYDIFFADRRIIHLLPRLIGKQFFKKKKHPLPIDLSHRNWTDQLKRGCGSALLYMRTGTCCQLNIGRLSMGRDDIVDNIIAAVEGAVEKIPKGWANVRSILLKSDESIGLPLYQALPERGLRIDVFPKGEGNVVDNGAVADADASQDSDCKMVDQGTGGEEMEKMDTVKKSGAKKGKLHKVLYMDTNLDEEVLNLSGGDKADNDHPLAPTDLDSDGEITTTSKKRKQTGKKDKKGFSHISGILASGEKSQGKKKSAGKKKLKTRQLEDGTADEETDEPIPQKSHELIGHKSQGKKERQAKKLKTPELEDGTADEETDALTAQKSQEKKKKGTPRLKTEQVEDATVHEGSDELIGDKSQGKKERQARKLKRQLEDGIADNEPQSGTAKKVKSKPKNIFEIDGPVDDIGLITPKSNGRKKQEEKMKGSETAQKETQSKTTDASSTAKKRNDTIKKLTNKEVSEKKTKKSKV